LKKVWAAYDESGEPTSLVEALREHLHLQHLEELIPWTYQDLSWARVASLTPLVFQEEAKGDRTARAILEEAADALALGIVTVARKLGLASKTPLSDTQHSAGTVGAVGGAIASHVSAFPVVLAGSVNQQPAMYRLLSQRITNALPFSEPRLPTVDASMGAALLALNYVRNIGAGVASA